jgi:DNA-binding IscR family transcriptional regulator
VMSEVLDVLEGNLAPMLCAPMDGATAMCGRESMCGSKELWRRVRDAVVEALHATTLAELVPERLPHVKLRPDIKRLPVFTGTQLSAAEILATP